MGPLDCSRDRRWSPPARLRGWVPGFFLHVATGVLAVAAHYSVMWLLLRATVDPVAASAVGFLAGAVARFLLSYSTVFSPTKGLRVTMLRFVGALGLQGVANAVILDGLLGAGLSLWLAQVCTTVGMTVANYLGYRLWVFR